MPTRPDPDRPDDGPALEPIHVLRPRRTDALAELFREWEEDGGGHGGYETVALPGRRSGPDGGGRGGGAGRSQDATRELPPCVAGSEGARRRSRPALSALSALFGSGRTVLVVAVAAAAVVGFGAALLLRDGGDGGARAAGEASASAPAPEGTPGPRGRAVCTASFRTVNSWQGGYQGEVTVTNAQAAAASSWTATVVPAHGARLTRVWDGMLTTTAKGAATVANASWNGELAPGASVTFGFLAATGASGTPSARVTCAATGGAP
ncbi:endo-1,4-beta-xylanase [Streptomyces zinciresistens K42]|uniref:Endo-1,4-beta-xylanase n=1 Tax=Streptomyces zinciresistens K42 TaxID=700597 RepID=G2GJH9_9ACTN|nr:endo-1,4-beta-xylanase [Streptomyces zinciresistens K42]